MQKRFRFGAGKVGALSGIIGTIGYLVINDLSKEDSLIKGFLKSLPFFRKKDKLENLENEEYYIIDDIPNEKNINKNNLRS